MARLRVFLIATVVATACSTSYGVMIFSDDFDDGDAVGWSYVGNDASEWGVLSGELNSSVGANDAYDGLPGIAYIDGMTAPDHFILKADIKGIRDTVSNFGHIGFAWGFNASTFVGNNAEDLVASYLRTHQDLVTTWSHTPFSGEHHSFAGFNAVNGTSYNLKIEVNTPAKLMNVWLDNVLIGTLSGGTFDTHVRHSGGNIGLIQWGEEVSYDNVMLFDESQAIPEASTVISWTLMGISGLGLAYRRRR